MNLLDDIYQHSDRWETKVESRFFMIHDVYSLKIVLLEIELWISFVHFFELRTNGFCMIFVKLYSSRIDKDEYRGD